MRLLFWIYISLFNIYRFIMIKNTSIRKIWYRNSLALNYWKFGKSDIDVTIATQSENQHQDILRLHNKIKKFIPIMGEVVFWNTDHAEVLVSCMSPLELDRDPVLKESMSASPKITQEDKIVFIHKFISENFDKSLSLRPEKTSYFLAQVSEKKILQPNIKDFITLLSELTGYQSEQFIDDYITLQIKRNEVLTSPPESTFLYALFFNKLCYLPVNKKLSDFESRVMEKVINWEIWGCYSQLPEISPVKMNAHMSLLLKHSQQHLESAIFQDLRTKIFKLGLLR